ncbi:MAG: hypothetical protein J6K32_10140 [Clostridia bacterium]|nr:hypothetical protein [Clostridia bacterium]
MNLNAGMAPGLCMLLAGAVITFFAGKLCRREESVLRAKILGVCLAAAGAILVFLP